jgi:hypothetical protein
MKKYRFDFDLDMWVKNVEINAESKAEAKELFDELIHSRLIMMLEDADIKDFNVSDLDIEEEESAEDLENLDF